MQSAPSHVPRTSDEERARSPLSTCPQHRYHMGVCVCVWGASFKRWVIGLLNGTREGDGCVAWRGGCHGMAWHGWMDGRQYVHYRSNPRCIPHLRPPSRLHTVPAPRAFSHLRAALPPRANVGNLPTAHLLVCSSERRRYFALLCSALLRYESSSLLRAFSFVPHSAAAA